MVSRAGPSRTAALVALLVLMGAALPVAARSTIGKEVHAAAAGDSSYVVRLRDISVPEIPETVIEPRRDMSYAERLAVMANMGLPMMAKMRETQSARDPRRQCLWVIGSVQPASGDLNEEFIWPSDQRLCAFFKDGTCIEADSVFALPTGDSMAPLAPLRISPRRSGWVSTYRSILVTHRLGDIASNSACNLFVAFRAGELVRRKLAWKDCTGIRLLAREEDRAAIEMH